jgi:predicted nucleic acid-binding protein
MRKILLLLISFSLLFSVGCASHKVVSQTRPDSYYAGLSMEADTSSGNSLFSSDSEILSDDDVKRILSFKFKPQKINRVAILPIGQIYWHGWSDELDKAGEAVQKVLIEKLKEAPIVYDASYLPTLLVPEEKTVGHLREAAARYQADLLLIYKAAFRTYEKYKIFSPDKTKAYCSLEAVLLDTRTGIVPFTILVSRTFTAEEKKGDMSFYETIRKAELSALESALEEVGVEVVNFMSESEGR